MLSFRKEELWINFDEVSKYLYNACLTIIKAGIMVNLYNFPLCNLDRRLYSIARKFNVSVDSLKSKNNLTNNNLSVGQILKI